MADLKLQILMQAVDKITAPFRGIAAGSAKLRESLGATAEKLKGLEAASKQLEQFRGLKAAARENANALDAAKAATAALARETQAADVKTTGLVAEKKKAAAEIRKLEAAMAAEGAETQKLAAELATAQARLKGLEKGLAGAEREAKKSSAALNKNIAEIRKLESASQGGATKLGELRSKLAAVGVDTRKMGDEQRRLKADMAGVTAIAEKQGAALARLQARLQATTQAREKMEQTQALAGSMAGAGAAGMATGGAGLALGAKTAMIGIDFDAMMSKVGALAKVEKTSAEFAALEKQAFDLGATTSFSASEAAEAMSNLAMAGFDANKILGTMPAMLNLAKAGSSDLGETASITGNILAGFKLEASQMGDAADVLVATFTNSNTNLAMLGETMKYVAPIATGIGYSLGDMAVLTGLLGNVGIQGSEAGTAMRAAMIRMAAPPKEAREQLEGLGVATKTVSGNMRPMASVLADIAAKTKNMGNAQRLEALSKIYGAEASAALAELVTQAGSDGIKAMTKTINAAHGLNDKISAQMADNAKGDLDNLSSAAEGVAIILTKINTQPLRELLQALSAITTKVGDWLQANPRLTATLTQIAAVMATVMVAGGALAIMIAGVLGPFAMARFAITALGLRVAPLAGGFFGAGRAAIAFNAALKASMAAGLRALPGRLAAGTRGFLAWSAASTRAAIGGIKALPGRIMSACRALATLTVAKLASLRAALFTAAGWRAMGSAALRLATGGLQAAGRAAWGFTTALLANPLGLLLAGIAAGAALIYKYWGPIAGFFRGLGAGIVEAFQPAAPVFDALGAAANAVAAPIQAVARWIGDILQPVNDVGGAAESMGKRWGQAIGGILTDIAELISAVLSLPAKVIGAFSDMWDGLGKMPSFSSMLPSWLGGDDGKTPPPSPRITRGGNAGLGPDAPPRIVPPQVAMPAVPQITPPPQLPSPRITRGGNAGLGPDAPPRIVPPPQIAMPPAVPQFTPPPQLPSPRITRGGNAGLGPEAPPRIVPPQVAMPAVPQITPPPQLPSPRITRGGNAGLGPDASPRIVPPQIAMPVIPAPPPVRIIPVAAAMAAVVAMPAAAATPSPAPPANVNQDVSITINAAPGMDETAIAREVRRQLEEHARKQRSAINSALYDGM